MTAFEKLVKDFPHHEICISEDTFPPQLRTIPDAPEKLYAIGNLKSLGCGLAIVGARRATPYGLNLAKSLAYAASSLGIVIISGGAKGCDSAAHRGALDANGITVAVLGGGADVLYPSTSKQIFLDLLESGGALVSEHPWGFSPLTYTFRARNRIIAGLSAAVLIVEAAIPSGTFTTADYALDAGREVLAVPGSVYSPNSQGTNQLIAQGARAVVDEQTFSIQLAELFGLGGVCKTDDLNAKGFGYKIRQEAKNDPLLCAIISEPCKPDDLSRIFNLSATELAIKLADYECRGLITKYPGGFYGPA